MKSALRFVVFFAALAAVAQPEIAAVDSIGMTVSNLDQAVQWYADVLTFEKVAEFEEAGPELEMISGVFGARIRTARLKLGEESIELTEFLAPQGRPIPVDSRNNDRWFQHIAIIVRDMDEAYATLRKHRVKHASSGPQTLPTWNRNAAGIRAFYFKDPDGHILEILQFPPDKGSARWRQNSNRIFLGIDHTAIVVADTDSSLRYYRDILGMEIVGESENHGAEQERLNGVFGARLRITTLQPASGPSIELLEYLTPNDGRPYPSDSRACDLWHWQTTLVAKDATEVVTALLSKKFRSVSPGIVDIKKGDNVFSKGILVRDVDGHAVRIVER
ncbi:MAG TPA: VOC family protein [Candidatus Hydrogenedentes bacterium]|nr:VOC family protein [Candidatus Hydrogenedentota bacterium]